jgi:hypothetical protein
MTKLFRPQQITKMYSVQLRRKGYGNEWINYNFQNRTKWYPAGWGFNKKTIGDQHSKLHYLACHAPAPIQKKWSKTYKNFMNKHFAESGKASMRYLNTWSCHSWM